MSRRARLIGLVLLIAAVASLPARAGSGDTTTGLIGHWKLDETSGTTAADSSDSNQDGTLQGGPTWTNGTLGGTLQLDGIDDYVALNAPIIGDHPFTYAAWINTTDVGSWANIVSNYSNTNGARLAIDGVGNWNFRVRDAGGSSFGPIAAVRPDEIGAWVHLVGLWDGSVVKLYVNGVLVDSVSGTPALPPTNNLWLGAGVWDGAHITGNLDDVRIYNRALTADDVKALYFRSNKICESPLGSPGELRYNADRSALQYCDGDSWVMTGLGSYTPVAVAFDAAQPDYLQAASLDGVSGTKTVTGSFWVRRKTFGSGGTIAAVGTTGATGNLTASFRSDDRFSLAGDNAGGTAILNARGNPITDSDWHHVLFSLNLSDPAKYHVYYDNVDAANNVYTFTDDVLSIVGEQVAIGSNSSGTTSYLDSDLADLWIDYDTYIDLSDAAMREKFISPNGMPMFLGEDGSLPTGSAPDIFLSGDVDSWQVNRGTGGGFTENGALVYASSQLLYAHAPGLASGLIGYWKLDETSGTMITDSSGNGNHGVFDGDVISRVAVGPVGGALRFSGGDHDLSISSASLDNLGSFSICFWVKNAPNTIGTSSVVQYIKKGTSGWYVDGNRAYLQFRLYRSGWGERYADPSLVHFEHTDWHHRCAVFDESLSGDSTKKLYMNGMDVSGDNAWNSAGPSGDDSDGPLLIGTNAWNETYIDDVRLYNRPLTPDEVKTLAFSACANPAGTRGTLIFNTDHKVMQYCNGVDWVAMSKIGGTGGSGCASPAGVAGELRYTSADEVMQYCNSEDWIALGKPVAPTDGLVSHWRLDETSGATATDSSGSNQDGTLQGGPTWTNGILGGALQLDGIYDYVALNDTIIGYHPFTYAAWINTRDVGGWANIVSNYSNTNGARLGIDDVGNWNFRVRDAGGSSFGPIAAIRPDEIGAWVHLVGLWDGSVVKLYVNGVLANSVPGTPALPPTNNLWLGAGVWDGAHITGNLDDVRVYNRALSSQEITDLYNAAK